MGFIRRFCGHLIVVILGVTTVGVESAATQTGQTGEAATFNIMLRGVRVGFETVSIVSSAGGWEITASGRQIAPIDLVTTRFNVAYAPDWQPQRLAIEGVLRGQLITMSASFSLTTVTVDMMQAGHRGSVLQQISPRTVVLPNNFYAGYEALAMRLGTAPVGTRFPIYVTPEVEESATVDRVTDRRFATPTGPIELKQIDMTFADPQGPVPVEIWIDSHSRLARIAMPSQSLVVLRDDLSSVMTREEFGTNPGDATLFIPAAGFNIGATITAAARSTGKSPAVVLVGASGAQDREEAAVPGMPMFSQLAGVLGEAGFVVARYDKRGTGQSGGRVENATLSDYADDVVSVVKFLRNRKDVDGDRIAVVGLGDGGAVALLAADRERHIKAVALLGAAGLTGREVTLEQQRRALSKLSGSDEDRRAKIALQTQVIDATIKGTGWEGVPADIRRQADTPFFRSWLLFDPATVIPRLDQPLLIVQGSLDTEYPVANADRLETLSRARKVPPAATTKVVVQGVNHRLVPATSGEVDEYATLQVHQMSPQVDDALINWLRGIFPAKK